MKLCQNELSQLLLIFLIEIAMLSSSLPQSKSKGQVAWHSFNTEPAKPVEKSTNVESNIKSSNGGSRCPNSNPMMTNNRYDETARKCGVVGRKEHCADNMIFYASPDSTTLGQCDCDNKLGERPLIYDQKTKKCYFTYEQSYCKVGQWLTFNQRGNPVCLKNPCLAKGRTGFGTKSEGVGDLVPFRGNGECVKLNQGYKQCKRDEVVTFVEGRVTPQCSKKVETEIGIGIKSISPVNTLNCPPGSFVSLSGRCQSNFVW